VKEGATSRRGVERPLGLAFLGDPNSVHMRRWMGYFSDRGYRVTLLLPEDRPAPDLPPAISVERFVPFSRQRKRPWGALEARRSLTGLLRRLEPDVLHAHYVTGNAWHAWLSGFHPYVVTVWGSDVLAAGRRSRRGRLYARLALRAADIVTGGSEHLIRAAVAAGARPERTEYVHFGVDTARFAPGPDPIALRARLDLGGRRVLLSNRIIAPLYRQIVVVQALARLPADVVAVMTRHHAQPDEVAAVEREARALGVADRLRIVETLDEADLPDLYRLADVVVSIPASDGGPVTVVEALSSGRPVVATDLPSLREWLLDLDPAGLVPVDDAAATATAVEAVLSRKREERDERAARSRAAVVARADWRASMEHMEQLYRNLAASRRGGSI
jgi:glycosyltransferase involved in cell wall biosynthesis